MTRDDFPGPCFWNQGDTAAMRGAKVSEDLVARGVIQNVRPRVVGLESGSGLVMEILTKL